jgi:hypothetical protein
VTAIALTLAAFLAATEPAHAGQATEADASRPVRIVRSTDTALDLELRTAPSSEGGAVSLAEVRFTREAPDAPWRLASAGDGARGAADAPPAFAEARKGTLRALGREVGEATGDAAILLELHDGDAAIGIMRGAAVAEAHFADDLVPALASAQSKPRARPTGLACLLWPAPPDEGAVRVLLLALLDPATQAAASSRLAGEAMRRTRDVREADGEAARAALLFAQPGRMRLDAPELAPYRWIHASLEATRGAS